MKDSGLHMEQLREKLREAKRTRAELVVSAAGWKARGNKIAVRKCQELIEIWGATIAVLEEKIAVFYAREESDDKP
jgi:hypothetical protein